jgi:nucleoid DNA-binding protein
MAAKKRKPVKVVAKKKVVKKPVAKVQKKAASKVAVRKTKVVAKKSTAAPAPKMRLIPPVTSVDKPFTKGQLLATLSGRTGVSRKEVTKLYDELIAIVGAHLKKQGPGLCTLPGLVKIKVAHKPATKARKGTNPFTGEEMMFKAKPARNTVKVRALKPLKSMV